MLRISHKIGRAPNLLHRSAASSSPQIFLESSRTAQICKRQLRSQENQEELGAIKHAANGHSLLIPRVSSTFQTIHLSSSNGTGFRHQGLLFHSRQQMSFNTHLSRNIQRYLSNKSSSDGAAHSAKDDGLNTTPKKKRELFDNTMLALISVAIASGAFSIAPDAIEYMKKSKRDYSEVDPEDDVYLRMKEVSKEIKGEIIHHVLGKDISEMAESENKAAVNTADVVADVLHSEALQNAVVSLITRVIGSAQFQSACHTLLKNLWQDLINDPETLAQVVALLNTAIKDENIKKSFKELVLGILQDDEVYNELTGLVVRLGEDKEVLVATKELLTESAHQALNDPEILDHSMEFATDIVGDNVIQRTSGEALRNTVTYAVRPSLSSFLSSLGVILLLFSASALGKARMAARQGREMDVSVSMVIQNIGDSVLKTMWKVGSIPSDTIVAVGAAIANVLLIPVRVSRDLVYNVQKMLGDAITTLHTTALKIIASPGKVVEGTRYIFKTTSQSMTQTMATALDYISRLPGILFFRMKEGIIFMACKVGTKSKSCAGTLYSMAETQTRHAMSRLSAIFSLGILQTSNSFSIMYANAAAWMKGQYFVINDKIEILLFTFIRSKLRPLFGND